MSEKARPSGANRAMGSPITDPLPSAVIPRDENRVVSCLGAPAAYRVI
jgi:hypothetical protein